MVARDMVEEADLDHVADRYGTAPGRSRGQVTCAERRLSPDGASGRVVAANRLAVALSRPCDLGQLPPADPGVSPSAGRTTASMYDWTKAWSGGRSSIRSRAMK